MTRRPRLVGWSLVVALGSGLAYSVVRAQAEAESEEVKPKYAIKEVMKGVHVAPEKEKTLRDRVLAGEAKAAEKLQLLDYYISLAENKPPKGEAAAWNEKTRAVVLSAAKVAVGRKDGVEALRKATNCAACHKDHKPPAEQ